MKRFTAIWKFNGAVYSDETYVLGEGSSSITLTAGQTIYFGMDDWLSGILAFMSDPPDPAPVYILEQSDGDNWYTLPLEETIAQLKSGVQLQRGSLFWGLSPVTWRKQSFTASLPEPATPPDTTPRYWVRLRIISGTITLDRTLPQLYNTYASVAEMGDYIGYHFDDLHPPTEEMVRKMLRANEDWLDNYSRRSWRPRVAYNETYDFNPYGFRVKRYPPWFVISLGLWNGTNFETFTEGRGEMFWAEPRTGMVRFTLPSFRLRYYSFLLSRYIRQPNSVQVTYVYGEDFDTSPIAAEVKNIILMRTGADLVTQNDWTGVFSSGLDNVPKPEKVKEWKEEAITKASELRMPLIN